MSKPTLIYFDGRGRAEIIRLVLAAAGVSYEDKRIKHEEWATLKPTMPTLTVPAYKTADGVALGQSLAIARFIASENGLYGKTALDRARCDMATDVVIDLREAVLMTFFGSDEEKAKNKAKLPDKLKSALTVLEKALKSTGAFFGGSEFSMADIIVFGVLHDMILPQMPKALDEYPLVKKNVAATAEMPKIKKYLQERPASNF